MRGRVLILIGAIVLLAVVAVVVLMSGGGGGEDNANTEGQTPVPAADNGQPATDISQRTQELVEIVVAIQDLPRGIEIPPDGVGIQQWPREALPEAGNYFVAEEIGDVVGQIARTDIFRGSPILSAPDRAQSCRNRADWLGRGRYDECASG